MENKKAIAIIKDELKHCKIHLEDKNKAPEYYQEMNELCEAYEMAIKALENSSWILTMKNIINKIRNKIRCALCKHFLLCPMCEYFNLEDSENDKS